MPNEADLYMEIERKMREWEALIENKKEARAKTAHFKLKLYMENEGITKEAMAKKLGISRMQLFRWLNRDQLPGKEMINKMEELGIIEKEK